MKQPAPGKAFEALVVAIERALSSRDGVRVQAHVFLKDSTGGRREHDILITMETGTHEVLISVECKDHGRPVTVPQVEAFAKKCERTGVHMGVIVSSGGFTDTARAAAAEMGIRCQELQDTEGFDWTGGVLAQVVRRKILDVGVHFPAESGILPPFQWFDLDGSPIDGEAFKNKMFEPLNYVGHPEAGRTGPAWESILLIDPPLYVIDGKGQRHDLKELDVAIRHVSTVEPVPISFHRYTGGQKDKEVASAYFGEGPTGARIVASPDEDGKVRFSFSPDDPKDTGWRMRTVSGGQIVDTFRWEDGLRRDPKP